MMTPYAIYEKMADTIPAPPGYFAIFLWETEQELSIRLTPICAWRAGRSLEPITNFASDEYYVRVATLHPDGSVWSEFDDTGDGAEIAVSGMLFDEWLLNRRLEYEAKGLGAPEEMQVRFDFNPDAPEDPLDDRPNLKAGDPADAAEIEREIAMMLARIGVTPPAPASVE